MEVSVISLIGFVMLVGVIVNNGIVLVDYINQLRLEGMEPPGGHHRGRRHPPAAHPYDVSRPPFWA